MRSPTVLIPHILRNSNGKSLSRTKIAKLLYLIDLAWLELYGSTLTGLPYAYHPDGPYCNEIEAALWSLQDEGVVRLHSGSYRDEDVACTPIDNIEGKVVHHVVENFASRSLSDLIDFVHKTPPMIRAGGKRLRNVEMQLEKSERPFSSDELLSLIDRREAARKGKSQCLNDVLLRLT